MAYDRYSRGSAPQGDYDDRATDAYGYRAPRDRFYGARDDDAGRDDGDRLRGRGDADRGSYGRGRSDFADRGYSGQYGSGYGNDANQFATRGQRDYSREPADYRYQDRGFFDRAGDEVRSWFGDEDAERRREFDARHDQLRAHDDNYHSWRSGQIAALDRDYDEYRRENQQRFSNEFGAWRTERQGQRTSLGQVTEHMDVVGSDGAHIGTVDKVRGDRIILTKSDADAGGRHHSIPSRWIKSVDDKVTVSKTAEEAQSHWRDEERNQAMFGDRDQDDGGIGRDHNLNRSFSGTY